jgi:hypothetical protein
MNGHLLLLKLGHLCVCVSCVCASHAQASREPPRRVRVAVSGGLSSVASIGGAGLGPYDTHRIYAHYISHNKHLGRSPPPLIQFHRGSKSRRAWCGELTRTRCPNAQCTLARRHTILRSRCQSCCDAARRLSLVVTPREGSHARFEPLEHRAHVRALRCTLRPTLPAPPRSCAHPLSLSLSLSHALRIRKRSGQRSSGSAIPHASPGTALNARRQRVRNSKSRRTQTWPWPNSP